MRKKGAVYHHGNLRRALVEATFRLVDSRGTDGFTLRAAARLAGVSDGAPYHHFEDKEALLAAVAEESFRQLREEMSRAADRAEKDSLARSRAMGVAYVLFAARFPARFRLMFGPIGADRKRHPELVRASAEAADLVKQALAQEIGATKLGSVDPLWLGSWALVHGLSVLAVDGHFGAAARNRRRLQQLVLAAMQTARRPREELVLVEPERETVPPTSGRRTKAPRERAPLAAERR
ncbi:MAG TPA: TetR/AcrR family transcriptional regulator [Polyangiaceae bacterium]|nr:TetR/AcrR family transcriptional regulator [Polyangiaceae bacterium]